MKNLVPKFILQKYKDQQTYGEFNAATMFIDIRGFTPLTEKLLKEKKRGAETLSIILEAVFKPITTMIYVNGGFITGFAGDAITAVFPREQTNTLTVVRCAQQIRNHIMENKIQKTEFGEFEIYLKIVISYGLVQWGTISNANIKTFYFRGKAIESCSKFRGKSSETEIIIDRSIYNLINQEKISLSELDQEYFILHEVITSKIDSGDVSNLVYDVDVDQNIYQDFVSDDIASLTYKGEFREITSVFISFKQYDDHQQLNNFISDILTQTINYGGYFTSLNFGDKGSTFLVVFGAPKSYEDNVIRALNFSLAIVNENVKVGINKGLAYAGFIGDELRCDYTVIGEVVNLSSRFMEKAAFNEIWVSQNITKNYSNQFQMVFIENILFKGKSNSIPVYRLVSKTNLKVISKYKNQNWGRMDERNDIEYILHKLENGKFGGMLNIRGEAGIGKTSLINDVLDKYRDKFHIGYLKCDSILRKSLNPVIYFFEYFFNQWNLGDETPKLQNFENVYDKLINHFIENNHEFQHISKDLIRIKPLIGSILFADYLVGSIYESLEPKQKYENTLFALRDFFIILSSIKPLVLFIDDYHWIDEETVKFFEVFIRGLEDYPVLLMTAGRTDETEQSAKFDNLKVSPVKQIHLSRFDSESTTQIARQFFDHNLSNMLIEYIYKNSQGNPFYIEQLSKYLKDNDFLTLQENEYNLAYQKMEIPDSITSIIISRIDKLSSEQKEIIQYSSVLGMDFDINILHDLINDEKFTDFDILTNNINSIINNGIFKQVDKSHYSYTSSLYRDVVYEMQLKSRLKNLHNLVGETLEKYYQEDETHHYDIANHFYLSGEKTKAIFYFSSAGQFFKQQYKNLEALDCYEKILSLNPDNKVAHDAIYQKAYFNFILGRWEQSITGFVYLIEKANELSQEKVLNAKNILSQIYLYQGKTGQALEIAFEGLKESRNLNLEVKEDNFILNIAQIYFRQNKYEDAMKMYQKIIVKHKSESYSEFISIVLGNIGLIHWNRGEFDQAIKCYQEQIEINNKRNDKFGLSVAYLNLGSVYFHRDDTAKAMEFFSKTKNLSEEIGYKRVLSSAVGNMGAVYIHWGYIYKAFECLTIKKKISVELGDRSGIGLAVGNLGPLYMDIGDYDFALACFKQKKQICEELDDHKGLVYADMYIGDLYRRKENFDLAIKNYHNALKFAENMNLKIGIVELSSKIGLTQAFRGNYQEALQMIRNSIDLENELKTKGYTQYYVIGLCFAHLDLTDPMVKDIAALTGMGTDPDEYFRKSLRDMKRENDTVEYAIFLKQYSKYLKSKKKNSQAEKYLKQSQQIYKKIKSINLNNQKL